MKVPVHNRRPAGAARCWFGAVALALAIALPASGATAVEFAFVAPVHSLIELLDGYLIVRRIRLPEGVDPDGITAAA